MNAAEWMRAIAHRTSDDDVASEAAEVLASFAAEPAHLVVACRRILAHHPGAADLWWLCSTVLSAAEPERAARAAGALLDSDTTAGHLSAALPLTADGSAVAVAGWSHTIDRAIRDRPDLGVVAIRGKDRNLASRLRARRTDTPVRTVDLIDLAAIEVVRCLVSATAVGPDRVVVPEGTEELLDHLAPRIRVWLVAGVGHVLPARTLDAMLAALEDRRVRRDEPRAEVVSLACFDRFVGPRGVRPPGEAAARPECPVVPELLVGLH